MRTILTIKLHYVALCYSSTIIKVTGILVNSLRGVNCRLWSHFECLGWKVTIFAHSGITQVLA